MKKDETPKLPLEIEYDKAKDQITIDGITFSGDYFRTFQAPDPDACYRFIVDGKNVLTLGKVFDALAYLDHFFAGLSFTDALQVLMDRYHLTHDCGHAVWKQTLEEFVNDHFEQNRKMAEYGGDS